MSRKRKTRNRSAASKTQPPKQPAWKRKMRASYSQVSKKISEQDQVYALIRVGLALGITRNEASREAHRIVGIKPQPVVRSIVQGGAVRSR